MHPPTDPRPGGHCLRRSIVALAVTLLAATFVPPAESAPSIKVELVAGGLADPVHVTHAGDGSGRLFVVERPGVVRIVEGGVLLPTPFLDVTLLVGSYFLEQGLLSIAFPDDYGTSGEFYVSYTDRAWQNTLARYRVSADPNVADPLSGEVLFTQTQPFLNHNGGLAKFGPDGYLYLGIGDGGVANDPATTAQNGNSLLGKLLRLDVSGPTAVPAPGNPFAADPAVRDEVWAVGLRNPWRFSFDRATGDLWLADVGQNVWEEVNHRPASSPGGENYGWDHYEGNHAFDPAILPPPAPYTWPVHEYSHAGGRCSVTGGYVYNGAAIAGLSGTYVYGDYCSGEIWGLTKTGSLYANALLLDSAIEISTFGEDEAGELYVAHLGLVGPGAVYRILPG